MIIKELRIQNALGIHARVSTKLVRCAKSFESTLNVKKDGQMIDLKNVLGVMLLNSKCGEVITLEIDGVDEEAAAMSMEQLFADKFGEM